MAKLRLYPQGFSVYQPVKTPNRVPPVKQAVQGWSVNATRRLVRWLYSVDTSRVEGSLVSFSLTLRDCPPTAESFKALCRAFFKRLARKGITDVFWLIEWQRRGVPHLHGLAIIPPDRKNWVQPCWVMTVYDRIEVEACNPAAQDTKTIFDAQGWFEYLAKHSVRGITHYQRSPENIPKGWQGKTGRMWGHRGDWPTADPHELNVDPQTYFRWRRLIRNIQIASARSRSDFKALSYARRMLKSSDRKVSSVRGLSRFMPLREALSLLSYLSGSGAIIHET